MVLGAFKIFFFSKKEQRVHNPSVKLKRQKGFKISRNKHNGKKCPSKIFHLLNWQPYYHEFDSFTFYLPPNWHMTFNLHDFALFNDDESSCNLILLLPDEPVAHFLAHFKMPYISHYAISHWKRGIITIIAG